MITTEYRGMTIEIEQDAVNNDGRLRFRSMEGFDPADELGGHRIDSCGGYDDYDSCLADAKASIDRYYAMLGSV